MDITSEWYMRLTSDEYAKIVLQCSGYWEGLNYGILAPDRANDTQILQMNWDSAETIPAYRFW